MEPIQLRVEPNGQRWSVKHNGGYLGHVNTRTEALAIARTIADWAADEGRPVQVVEVPAKPADFR
jgi:hypothetical protein